MNNSVTAYLDLYGESTNMPAFDKFNDGYKAGAEEQHKEDMEFAEWYGKMCFTRSNANFGNAVEAYEYWLQNVKGN